MALEYTEEKLNSLDKETVIQLFLAQQAQLKQIDHTLQLVLEQVADLKRHRFGRSSEKHETENQISFMEKDGKIVFFNEAEAVAVEETGEAEETAVRQHQKKRQGKREEDLSGLPVAVIEHSMSEEELEERFGKDGFKQLPDEVYRRYGFTPAKIEIEEHHVKVYAGKKTDEIVRAPHPECLLRGSLVSPSLEAAVMNAKYVNAVPETPVLVNKDGRPAGSKSFMWVYRTGRMYTEQPIILYEYQKTRNASHPREFLEDFKGICVTDGYQVYHTIENEREDLKISGCWSHARRRFDEAVKALPKAARNGSRAYLALGMIQAIYREEKLLKELPSEERKLRRQLSVRPLVEACFTWAKENIQKVPQKSKTWEGFQYSINQEKYLKVFLDDGEVPMDNNAAEQSYGCRGKIERHYI